MSKGQRPTQRGVDSARERSKAFHLREAERARRRRLLRWVGAAVAIAVVAVVIVVSATGNDTKKPSVTSGSTDSASATLTGPMGPEGIALEEGTLLAPVAAAAQGATVDGVQCNSMEQVAYHIHIHLAVYVNGALRPIPPGIGVVTPVAQQTPNGVFDQASRCYYWLHTHAQDGIIHVEAPSQARYTLGNFFHIWQQPLSATRVGPAAGAVTAYVNGARFTGDPTTIPMNNHEDVQLDVGTPTVAPKRVDWSQSQL